MCNDLEDVEVIERANQRVMGLICGREMGSLT